MTDQEINIAIAEACGWTEIKEAVTNALKNFNQQLAASLHETVKMKLGEALNNLKVQVNT